MESGGLRYVVDCPEPAEPVYVDLDMWEKIVFNLLSNAFKLTLEGEVRVGPDASTDRVELRVRDTGVGVPAEELPRLFERFHQYRGRRSRSYEGTGIGLSLVQDLVELHGGTVLVDSVKGEGTVVTVRIPTGSAHLPPDQVDEEPLGRFMPGGADLFVEETLHWGTELGVSPAGPAGASHARAARILIADDNADMRQHLQRVLGGTWAVEAVADGAAALDAARRHRPDLVVADIMMPGLDGFALLRALRAEPGTARIPVLLLSARAGEEAAIEGLQAGADDYLVKPFSARELVARVRASLDLAQVRDQASGSRSATWSSCASWRRPPRRSAPVTRASPWARSSRLAPLGSSKGVRSR